MWSLATFGYFSFREDLRNGNWVSEKARLLGSLSPRRVGAVLGQQSHIE
jgi:hypothetical protein